MTTMELTGTFHSLFLFKPTLLCILFLASLRIRPINVLSLLNINKNCKMSMHPIQKSSTHHIQKKSPCILFKKINFRFLPLHPFMMMENQEAPTWLTEMTTYPIKVLNFFMFFLHLSSPDIDFIWRRFGIDIGTH